MDDRMIERLAALACLSLEGEEKDRAARGLDEMIRFVDQMKSVDTRGAEEMTHPLPLQNIWREDLPGEADEAFVREEIPQKGSSAEQGSSTASVREEILQSAPRLNGEFFEVPLTVPGEN